jgi:hypothetical protein
MVGRDEGQGGEQAVLATPFGVVHGLVRGVEKGRGVGGVIRALDSPGVGGNLHDHVREDLLRARWRV